MDLRMTDSPGIARGRAQKRHLSRIGGEAKPRAIVPRTEPRCVRVPQTIALRHVAFEDLGLLAPLLAKRGHEVRYVDVPTTDLENFDPLTPDLLVVLGGPIGVYENHLYPFLDTETELLARRLAARRPTLGICLGSQLMAKALGARVYPSGVKEIGWATLTLTPEGRDSPLRHLDSTPVLHWHGDTFDLPEGAERLASTAVCKNQAFRIGDAAFALQFHIEASGRALEAWFVGHTGEIAATPGISVPQLRADTARCSASIERAGAACLEEWLAAAGL
jgi:GMP synthase (glutamine-hydrolysing)